MSSCTRWVLTCGLVLGLLGALLPGCADVDGLAADAGQPDTGAGPTERWQALETSAHEDLYDLHGTRISDVWAVGARGVILHFDGVQWTQHHSPAKLDLHAIWAPREGGVAWAVGAQGTVVRYDGEHWYNYDVETDVDLNAIWGSGPNDVWVVGDGGTVMRFDGTNWIVDRAPTGLRLNAVWGLSSRDLYVAAVGDVFHYDGKGWQRVVSSGITTYHAIWGSGPDNVWVLGDRGTAHRFDGQRWSKVELTLTFDEATEPARARRTTALWGSGPDDVWAIGQTPPTAAEPAGDGGPAKLPPPAVLHFDGEGWTVQKRLESDQRLHDVWTSGPNDVWTTGSDGLLLRYYEPPR